MRTCLMLLCLASTTTALTASYFEANEAAMWANFKTTYGRKYASDAEEDSRRGIYRANMQRAAALQARNPLAQYGENLFADRSEEEMKPYHNLQVPLTKPAPEMYAPQFTQAELAAVLNGSESVDWRTKGAVTDVKNQANCGSCWAFSTTGGVEGQWFMAGNKLTALSEQELVSCDKGAYGCQGGLMDQALGWVIDTQEGKMVTEAAYPYASGSGAQPACSKDLATMEVGATIGGYLYVASDEDQMAAWVIKNGPLSIALDARTWPHYEGGIMTNADCSNLALDHGVLIVGVTADYWIVKNSWSTKWGEQGFARVQRGYNVCLIRNYAVSSSIAKIPKPGPHPEPPATPTMFVQTCDDAACTQNCANATITAGCNSHAIFTFCNKQNVTRYEYIFSNCAGLPEKQDALPTYKCAPSTAKHEAGKYVYRTCPGEDN